MTMADHQSQEAFGQYLLDPSLSLDADSVQSQSQLTTPSSASDSSSILFGASHASFVPAPGQGFVHHHQQTPHQSHISSLDLTLDPSQLNTRPSSIGPSRIVTRRQARIAQESAAYATAADTRMPQNQRQSNFGDVCMRFVHSLYHTKHASFQCPSLSIYAGLLLARLPRRYAHQRLTH